jgi:hypothetical protein
MIIMGEVISFKKKSDTQVADIMAIYGEESYMYWLEYHAGPHVTKWLDEHEDFNIHDTKEFVEHMIGHFKQWVSESK